MPFPHRKLGIIILKFFRAFNEQFRVTLFLLALKSWAKMIAVQRRFGLRGKVVGYHGIQSFREGEVTPEQAFAIGKETARRMWGDRYQVLVTVHLKDNDEMNTLIESIQTQGILSPLIVRPIEDTDEYEVISGNRRLHAAQKTGITEGVCL